MDSGGSSGYDANGNVTTYDDGIYVTTYTYDALNRLTRENNQKAGKTYVYTYNNGNLTSRKTYAYTTGTLGAVQATETYTYGKTNFHDRVTAFNGKAITYTAETGVMTGYGDYALTWFKIGLLGSYSKTGDTHTFTYDMDGRRLSRTDNGVTTTFVYAGDQLVGLTWGGNTLAFICNAAGEYVGFTYNGTNYYYVKNLQGDVVQIVNAAKTTVVKYYYDAWGYNFATEGSLASTVGAVNPIRYRSYYYDSGTGLYYLHSRYYNPELRRFISPDKLLDTREFDGFNLFAYCGNNPTGKTDSSGTIPVNALTGRKEGGIYKKEGIVTHVVSSLGDFKVTFYPKGQLIHITDSYKVHTKEDKEEIIDMIMESSHYNPNIYSSSKSTMLIEWSAHNFTYKLASLSTAYNNFLKFRGYKDPIQSSKSVDFRFELENSTRRNYYIVTLGGFLQW